MRRILAPAGLILACVGVACGDAASNASTKTVPVTDSSAGSVGKADSAVATPAASPVADVDARMGTNLGGPDSAIRIQIATQPKSRTKADSISLVASIRKGLKQPGWPVQGPAPLAGSILPAKRIVAF